MITLTKEQLDEYIRLLVAENDVRITFFDVEVYEDGSCSITIELDFVVYIDYGSYDEDNKVIIVNAPNVSDAIIKLKEELK